MNEALKEADGLIAKGDVGGALGLLLNALANQGDSLDIRRRLYNLFRSDNFELGGNDQSLKNILGLLFPAAFTTDTAGRSRSIAEKGIAFLERLKSIPLAEDLEVTPWWKRRQERFLGLTLPGRDAVLAVHLAQSPISGFDHRILDPTLGIGLVHAKVRSLQDGFGRFAPREDGIEESPYSLPDGIFEYCGSKISTSLLWHAAFYFRTIGLFEGEDGPKRVLEVGGGYGGLARLFLNRHPGMTYIIVDIAESIFYQYCYLSLNFPGHKILLVDGPEGVPGDNFDDYDVVLIPPQFMDCLEGVEADLALNTGSFQEMPGPAAKRYVRLIEEEMSVRKFFSVNYFIDDKAELQEMIGLEKDRENLFIPDLNRNWDYVYFDINPPYIYADASTRNWLEMAAVRHPRSDEEAVKDAKKHYKKALGLPVAGSDWFGEIWSAVRLDPKPDYVHEALRGLEFFTFGPTDIPNALHTREKREPLNGQDALRRLFERLGEYRWLKSKLD